ncbi:hypothetical protein GE118_00585 [Mycoplasma sp. NEAQ87857]|uniref:YhjD/YihY/BrkB family envelope integrity protein n=1 Tax=Mycoplasma sp. NEAQ87857 TaxID=2683967 RepID=UPI001317EA4C|nr:YhjD/YihY/BrkB family envelope integrity protein [Mycoplasma sp. NEAQ87857]QGZ97298.1 hypothetical protein GE118_00585 [Mycoplasma sp. NEAQ87857]
MKNLNKNMYKELTKKRIKKSQIGFNKNVIYWNALGYFFEWLYLTITLKIALFITLIFLRGMPKVFKKTSSNEKEKKKVLINKTVKIVHLKITSIDFSLIWNSPTLNIFLSFIPSIYLVIYFNTLAAYIFTWFGFSYQNQSNFINTFSLVLSNIFSIKSDVLFPASNTGLATSADVIKFLIVILSFLYFSSNGYGKLIYSSNYLFEHKRLGTYWGNKLKGIWVSLGTTLLLFAFTFLYTIVIQKLKINAEIFNQESINWESFLFYSLFSLMFLFCMLLLWFKYLVSFKIKIKHLWRGLLLSLIPIFLLNISYHFISEIFLKKDNYSGVLNLLVIVGLYVGLIVYFFFIGLIFNVAYYRVFVGNRTYSRF